MESGPSPALLGLVGQYDTRPRAPMRGLEDLEELRVGSRIRWGGRWIGLSAVRGLASVSPEWGIRARIGSEL